MLAALAGVAVGVWFEKPQQQPQTAVTGDREEDVDEPA
jgi:hypothetical protein